MLQLTSVQFKVRIPAALEVPYAQRVKSLMELLGSEFESFIATRDIAVGDLNERFASTLKIQNIARVQSFPQKSCPVLVTTCVGSISPYYFSVLQTIGFMESEVPNNQPELEGDNYILQIEHIYTDSSNSFKNDESVVLPQQLFDWLMGQDPLVR